MQEHCKSFLDSANASSSNRATDAASGLFAFLREVGPEACRSTAFYGNQLAVCLDAGVGPDADHCLVYVVHSNRERAFSWLRSMKETTLRCQLILFHNGPSVSWPEATANTFSLGAEGRHRDSRMRPVRSFDSARNFLSHQNRFIDHLSLDLPLTDSVRLLTDLVLKGSLRDIKQLALRVDLTKASLSDLMHLKRVLEYLEGKRFLRFHSYGVPASYRHLSTVGRHELSVYWLAWINVVYRQASLSLYSTWPWNFFLFHSLGSSLQIYKYTIGLRSTLNHFFVSLRRESPTSANWVCLKFDFKYR